ncbi:MAG: hypothetical protein K9N46_07655 [Candidatus Marinimicrobia bacterium]|nr:hypothetical protein [Candidatus Neomarinimicrobiota bacterium]MCF7880599.1 hypothetical protein [Candidatus Neomarinimicrobiota bacterium]
MAHISVDISESDTGWTANVTVSESDSSSSHTVKVDKSYCRKLTSGDYTPEQLVETSFEFLLAREPKEAILSQFELPVIARYFPEYENKIGVLLAGN